MEQIAVAVMNEGMVVFFNDKNIERPFTLDSEKKKIAIVTIKKSNRLRRKGKVSR